VRAEAREDRVEIAEDLRDSAIGQARRDEPGDLAIAAGVITVDHLEWIGRDILAAIEPGVERFEFFAELRAGHAGDCSAAPPHA
jgi:hypothetical protein